MNAEAFTRRELCHSEGASDEGTSDRGNAQRSAAAGSTCDLRTSTAGSAAPEGLAGPVLGAGSGHRNGSHGFQPVVVGRHRGGRGLRLALAVVSLFVAMSTTGCGWERIPPGSVGVKFNANSGLGQTILKPEVVFVNPFTDRLIIYPTSINNATYVQASSEGERIGDDAIRASTIEGAILPIDVTIAYRIPGDHESVMKVFNSFGVEELKEIQRRHIRWATVVAVNEVSGQKSIFDLISKERAKLGPDIKAVLAPMMETEVHPPAEITQRIQEQQSQRADLERARIEQQQAKIEAQTILTNAQKEAEQNRLLATQGDVALALKRIERRRKFIAKWDGKLPVIGSGVMPNFQ
jgi:regulator of protease activity HflC (stomatin/prohibitin superfamily)